MVNGIVRPVSPLVIEKSSSPQAIFVSIIGGKHKGKKLRFIKRTAQRIAVQLDDNDDDGKIAYLMPSHVDMKDITTTSISPYLQKHNATINVDHQTRATEHAVTVDQENNDRANKTAIIVEDEYDFVSDMEDEHDFISAMEDFSTIADEEKVSSYTPTEQQATTAPGFTTIPTIPESKNLEDRSSPSPTPAKNNNIINTGSSSSSRSLFHPKERVSIKSGAHAGKIAIFVKYTAQRVAVTLEDDLENRVRYLLPTSLQPLSLQNQSLPSQAPSEEKKKKEEGLMSHSPPQSLSLSKTKPFIGTTSSSSSSSSFKLTPQQQVRITKGTHAGKNAIFVKYTNQRVAVTLQDDDEPKIRYFMRDSLEPLAAAGTTTTTAHASSSTALTSVTVNNPYANIPTQPKNNQDSNKNNDDSGDIIIKAFREFFQKQSQRNIKVENVTNIKIQETLFGAVFQERAVFVEVSTESARKLPSALCLDNQEEGRSIHYNDNNNNNNNTIFLAAVKVHQREKTVTCAYLYAPSNDYVRESLLHLGAFDKLVPYSKTAARLELLLSTAARCNLKERPFHVHALHTREFCNIEENGNVGCGFIPRFMIERFLGSHAVGRRTFALQVRIIIPSMGTFKGVLMEKPGIEKIELPSSMKKVGASSEIRAAGYEECAWLMINQSGIFPYLNRIQQQEGQFNEEKEIPEQARWMLTQKGVSNSYLSKGNRYHSDLIGVADPTDSLPPGSVFVTGFHDTRNIIGEKVLISRFPMTEACDGLILSVVRERPTSMTEQDWEFLCNKSFGVVVFGNPPSGQRALPEHIAQGDLDGDGYFVCWDPVIVNDALIGDRPVFSTKKPSALRTSTSSLVTKWWAESQKHMMDQGGRNQRNHLVGLLCNLWKSRLQSGLQQEALGYGRAYKEAIDVKKHGGKVDLPAELWEDIPKHLHLYLNSN